jgi:hypothetical protein
VFRDAVSVDEAEGLLEWLQKNPAARIDLSACAHLHPANLQVLMATRANGHCLAGGQPVCRLAEVSAGRTVKQVVP